MGIINKLAWALGVKKKPEPPKVKFVDTDSDKLQRTMPINMSPAQYYIIKAGGEYLIYNSIEQMDSENRKKFELFENSNAPFTVFVDGEGKTYNNVKDIPEEIQKALAGIEKL